VRRIRFTTTGWMESPGYMLGLPHTHKVPIPAVVAVCEKDDGSILLVDAGWSAEECRRPASIGRVHGRMLGVRVRPQQDVASQLRRAGLDPARVTTIVATHLHLDHIGGAVDFPNAEIVATHDEATEAYRATWLNGYRREDLECLRRLRLVRLPPSPLLGFSHSFALDDEVTLLDAHGHTAGHTAIVIRDGSTLWVHGGDAAYHRRELTSGVLCPLSRFMAHDRASARVAQRRLSRCERERGDVRVVLSHDAHGFSELPKLGEELAGMNGER